MPHNVRVCHLDWKTNLLKIYYLCKLIHNFNVVPVKDLIDVLIEFDRLFLYKNHLKFDSIKINNI